MTEGQRGFLEFERPLVELEQKIRELRDFEHGDRLQFSEDLARLEKKADRLRAEIFSKLTRWQRVQLARHPKRPYTLDYLKYLAEDFIELHGDRGFADDAAIVGGLGVFRGRKVLFVGHQKGRDLKEKLRRHFGMPHPEGYRKALRLMNLAARFGRPVVTLIDTPGAYPGIGAEERGQSEAIARNLLTMSRLRVPIIGIVIGEGGSGGALALGVCDLVFMQENAIYSVISPEGCAAILWGDRSRAEMAADALKLTARDLDALGVIDGMIREPAGGAHRDPEKAAIAVGDRLEEALESLAGVPPDELVERRLEKYARMGRFVENGRPGGQGAS
jgi:acetyl-CoA carboxylase carboxyl transferase subunit alpha